MLLMSCTARVVTHSAPPEKVYAIRIYPVLYTPFRDKYLFYEYAALHKT